MSYVGKCGCSLSGCTCCREADELNYQLFAANQNLDCCHGLIQMHRDINDELDKEAEGRRTEIEELNRQLELARHVVEAAKALFEDSAMAGVESSALAGTLATYDAAVGREGGK